MTDTVPMQVEIRRVFYRCPGETVAWDVVLTDGGTRGYILEHHGMCPLCETPLAEHESFTLGAIGTVENAELGDAA